MQFYLLFIPSVLIFYIVFLNICTYKFIIREIVIGFIITYLISLFICFLTYPNYDVPGNLSVIICQIVFSYRRVKNIFLSAFFAVLTAVICVVSGNITTVLVINIFNLFIDTINNDFILYYSISSISLIISFIVSKLVGRQVHLYLNRLSGKQKNKFTLYGLYIAIITLSLIYVNVFVYKITTDRILIEAINTILVTLFFLFMIFILSVFSISLQKQIEAEYKQKSQEDLRDYTRYLENAYDDIRSFRHDHINLLLSLYGFTEKGDMEGLTDYLNENISYARNAMIKLDISMDKLKFINIPELKGLLSAKLIYVQSMGIDVKIDISEPIEAISASSVDLCRIVGIIIDNAIDELLANTYENAELKFGITKSSGDILIICTNTCKTAPQAELIFNKGYSTKENSRGLGLYILNKISEEYENMMVTTNVLNNEFTIMVIIRQV